MASHERVSAADTSGFPGRLQDPNEPTYPIDLIFLAHQTLGDEQLETELLRLFERQAGEILAALADTGNVRTRGDLAHRLKGSARAIGAAAVAKAAERFELAAQKNASMSSHFAALAAAVEEARSAIRELMPIVASAGIGAAGCF